MQETFNNLKKHLPIFKMSENQGASQQTPTSSSSSSCHNMFRSYEHHQQAQSSMLS
jgi:hypothetical protein